MSMTQAQAAVGFRVSQLMTGNIKESKCTRCTPLEIEAVMRNKGYKQTDGETMGTDFNYLYQKEGFPDLLHTGCFYGYGVPVIRENTYFMTE